MKILTLIMFLVSTYAFASEHSSHMIEFNADSLLQTTLSFDRTKTRGQTGDDDTQLDLNLNYAYQLPQMDRLQVGSKVNYNKGTDSSAGDFENYGLKIGGFLNLSSWYSSESLDLLNTYYVSFFLGMDWANNYSGGDRKNEFLTSVLAYGKRFDLSRWKIAHLTYSPEIALENINSTMGKGLEYSQSIQFRVLQFSMFW